VKEINMPSRTYLVRLAEEALVTGLATFGAVLAADDAAFGTAAVLAALTAAGRAAYGVAVKSLAGDVDRPSAN
jgi:hypothetical protein